MTQSQSVFLPCTIRGTGAAPLCRRPTGQEEQTPPPGWAALAPGRVRQGAAGSEERGSGRGGWFCQALAPAESRLVDSSVWAQV